jgi:urea transport system substrate-binding protein
MKLFFTKTQTTLIALCLLLCVAAIGVLVYYKPPIKIGVVYSQSNYMSANEKPLIDAIELAVDKLNSDPKSLLLGRKVKTIIKDGESPDKVFARVTEELMTEGVDVVFGCWTSSCRKRVIPIIEKHNSLLYYPLQYEGIEESDNVIYLGELPNQQIKPALEYAFGKLKKTNIYLVGSDYIFPRTANQVISVQAEAWGGKIVGYDYAPLGSTDFKAIVSRIKKAEPEVIFNTLNGISNASFFSELRRQGIHSKDIPSFSFSIPEDEIARMDDDLMTGDYVVWSYMQNPRIESNEVQIPENKINKEFIAAFKNKYGSDRVIGSPMATAYTSVLFWAEAVKRAKSSKAEKVNAMATDISFMGPAGMLYLEKATRHTWKDMHVAQITEEHGLETVWSSRSPIRPLPYDGFTPEIAKAYLQGLKIRWKGDWGAQPIKNSDAED